MYLLCVDVILFSHDFKKKLCFPMHVFNVIRTTTSIPKKIPTHLKKILEG
jgi:hypothetical protein